MDLKDELENELAMAIFIEKRLAGKLGPDDGRELLGKIKGALSIDQTLEESCLEAAEAASAN